MLGVRLKSLRTQYRPSEDYRVSTVYCLFCRLFGVLILRVNDIGIGKMAKRKLTAKQEAFSHCVASGAGTQSQCYREVYDCEGSKPAVVHSESSRLLANPMVAARVQVIKGRIEVQRQAQSLSDRDRVLERLRQMIDTAEPTDSNRLRAIELLGRSAGVFVDRIETADTSVRDSDAVSAEIERRLGDLLSGSQGQAGPEPEASPEENLH